MDLAFYRLLLLLLLLSPSSFGSDILSSKDCAGGNYTTNSTYSSNLNGLFTFFTSLDSTNFTTRMQGSTPDSTYGLILCRGDASSTDCTSCIQTATQDVLSQCPGSKQATVWYDNCELRYSDLRFFSSFNSSTIRILSDQQTVGNHPEDFVRAWSELLDKVVFQAAYNSSLMFATGTAMNEGYVTVTGLAQCTRDLSKDECNQCLKQIQERYMSSGYQTNQGGRALADSCNFRYEVFPFYNGDPTILLNLTTLMPPSTPTSPPTPSPPTSPGAKGSRITIIVSIVISVAVVVLILACCILFRRRTANNRRGMANPEKMSITESLYFDLPMLRTATSNFSDNNELGKGGFGPVYKGVLPDGQEIAVKRLSKKSKQGIEELKNELLLVAKLQHRNLVRLLGVCLEEGEKLLVYEYMPNGSLDHFLFDPIKCKEVSWERRFKIVKGIARGLLYLHEDSHLKVLHRDVKAGNVLLDTDMTPKISDFGLARLFEGDETHGSTSKQPGTPGYMAPEYYWRGQFSTKLDVYSYGILVLEIVTGRKNSSFKYDSQSGQSLLSFPSLLSYAWKHWGNGTTLEIVDPSLGQNYSRNEASRCVQIGLLCAEKSAADRPSMSSVFLMLNSPFMPLEDPIRPAYLEGLSTVVRDVSSSTSRQSSFDHTDMFFSAPNSWRSTTPNPPEISQKHKEMVHSDSMTIMEYSSSRANALPSRLSQTAPVGDLNRD